MEGCCKMKNIKLISRAIAKYEQFNKGLNFGGVNREELRKHLIESLDRYIFEYEPSRILDYYKIHLKCSDGTNTIPEEMVALKELIAVLENEVNLIAV